MKIIRTLSFTLLSLVMPSLAMAEDRAPDRNLVSLQADARTTLQNDLMIATLFVEADNKDPSALSADISRTITQATRTAQGFKGVKVSSGAQSTWPVYDEKNRVRAWRSRAELRLESRDFDATARAIAQMQTGMQIGNINFALAPETARSGENGLIESAIAAFRARADIVAKAFGQKEWRIVNVNIGTGNDQPPMPMARTFAMKASADAMPAQEFSGGDSSITVTINGTIELQSESPSPR